MFVTDSLHEWMKYMIHIYKKILFDFSWYTDHGITPQNVSPDLVATQPTGRPCSQVP